MSDRRVLLALAALSPVLVLAPLAVGAPADVLLAAPLIVLLAPLLAGRYVGERVLLRCDRGRPTRRVRVPQIGLPKAATAVRPRREQLTCLARAVRPPPWSPAVSHH